MLYCFILTQKDEFLTFLSDHHLPKLNLSKSNKEEYLLAIRGDVKGFKSFLKVILVSQCTGAKNETLN